jgi:shikimate dehydrogenase
VGVKALSGATRVAAVIGTPIRHSLSPALYNAAYDALGLDWLFVAFDVPAGRGAAAVEAVRTLGLVGLSVTMPHKEDAAGACDVLTDDAAALRSVNSVRVTDDGQLAGDSTDGEGFRRALVEAGHDPAGRPVLVLGAGGAARAVVLALARAGCDVQVAARRPEAAAAAVALAPGTRAVEWADREAAVASVDVLVQATPIGMGADGATPVQPGALRPGLVVADLVYHPLETPLLAAARAAGAVAVDGLGMLVHQAALQVEAWSGRDAPLAAMYAAARAQLGA